MERMEYYKDYMYGLRKAEMAELYLIVYHDTSLKVREYGIMFGKIGVAPRRLSEDESRRFYFTVKNLLSSYLEFWMDTIDRALMMADTYENMTDRNELLGFVDNTLQIIENRQQRFLDTFSTIDTPLEQKCFDEICEKSIIYRQGLLEMKKQVEAMKTPRQVKKFASEHFKTSVRKKTSLITYTHVFVAHRLADRIVDIRYNLENIVCRLRANLQQLVDDDKESLDQLQEELYNTNKLHMFMSRAEKRNSTMLAQLNAEIEKQKENLENYQPSMSISQVRDELDNYNNLLKKLLPIEKLVTELKQKLMTVTEQEIAYNKTETTEISHCKQVCWKSIGENLKAKKLFLQQKLDEACKALLTFFTVRGSNTQFQKDLVGEYTIDSYGHQVYAFDCKLKMRHVFCDGTFIPPDRERENYYDNHGCYFEKGGERIYQIAPCTSQYKLGDDDILHKVTKDCGHSEKVNDKCRMTVRDPNDRVHLPDIEAADLKQLDQESVHYLWRVFGGILPLALKDVAEEQPRNPIQFLAHRLLTHKYSRSAAETNKLNEEALQQRENLLKRRQEEQEAIHINYKSKEPKHVKPEGMDVTSVHLIYAAMKEKEDEIYFHV